MSAALADNAEALARALVLTLESISPDEVVEQLYDAAAMAALDVAIRRNDPMMIGRLVLNLRRALATRLLKFDDWQIKGVSSEEAACRAVAGVLL